MKKKLLLILILISCSVEAAKNKAFIAKKKKNNRNITFIKTPILNAFVLRRFPTGTTSAQQYRAPVPNPVLRRFGG